MARLPGVNITEAQGTLGVLIAQQDGIAALILTCTAVSGVLEYGQAYQLFGLADAEALQINKETNEFAWKEVAAFYTVVGPGAELWVMPIDTSDATGITMAEAFNPAGNYGPALLEAAGGNIRLLGIAVDPQTPSAVVGGLEGDVHATVINAQALAAQFAARNQPLSVILDGRGYTGAPGDLTDYSTGTYDRVSILIGGSEAGSLSAAIGTTLGSLAGLPVHRKLSRKRNGAVNIAAATFTNGELVDGRSGSFAALAAKNYLFFRTFTGQTGYYFAIDATCAQGDYSSIARRRTMDKVTRIAYAVYVEWLDEVIPVNDDGTLSEAAVAALKGDIENQVGELMVGPGELSDFTAIIDPEQNVLSTDTINIQLAATPVGYSSQINVEVAYNNPFLNA